MCQVPHCDGRNYRDLVGMEQKVLVHPRFNGYVRVHRLLEEQPRVCNTFRSFVVGATVCTLFMLLLPDAHGVRAFATVHPLGTLYVDMQVCTSQSGMVQIGQIFARPVYRRPRHTDNQPTGIGCGVYVQLFVCIISSVPPQ